MGDLFSDQNPGTPRPADDHRRAAASVVARCGVCTVSDTRTPETDRAGQLLRRRLTDQGHRIVNYRIVPDEPEPIRSYVHRAPRDGIDAVFFSGGTGIAVRDTTPDVIAPLLDKELPGFGELFRLLSYEQVGAAAFLSRALAGVVGPTAVFCLPGSPAAVELALEKLVLPELPHLLSQLRR